MSDMTLKAEQERQGWTAFGHRVGGGLFNRDYRARISVGKRSGVRPGVYRASARSTSNWREIARSWHRVLNRRSQKANLTRVRMDKLIGSVPVIPLYLPVPPVMIWVPRSVK
jgi:hypothetical protein